MKALHCIVACWWFSACTILSWCRRLMQRECTLQLCCAIYNWLVHLRSALWCVLCACTNITQKERQAFSPFVKALYWVTFCWTFSVCATYRLCRHLVHHKCAMYRVVLCCVLFCVNSTQRMAACLHCECVVNYTYSIVNVLHCYIFYGDFLVCTTRRVCYAWRMLAFFREMIRSRKGIGVLQILSNGSPDKKCQLNIKPTRSHHSVPANNAVLS